LINFVFIPELLLLSVNSQTADCRGVTEGSEVEGQTQQGAASNLLDDAPQGLQGQKLLGLLNHNSDTAASPDTQGVV